MGPRPGKKSIKRLQNLNLTHCCTLLSEREGGPLIEKICTQLGSDARPCAWVWLPIEGGNLEVLRHTDVAGLVAILKAAIAQTQDPHLYLHCSAGIHRTGFVAYILLRLIGYESAAALSELAAWRQVTAAQVGEERIELAEEIALGLIGS